MKDLVPLENFSPEVRSMIKSFVRGRLCCMINTYGYCRRCGFRACKECVRVKDGGTYRHYAGRIHNYISEDCDFDSIEFLEILL